MDELDALIAEAVGDVRDPYPEFARRRRETPVLAEIGFNGKPGYNLYRYEDVARVLHEPEAFSSRVYVPTVGMVFGPSIIQYDGSEHHRHRSLIGGSFRRTAVAKLEPELIEPTVHALVDSFAARGEADLVRELTIRFPVQIIAQLLGIPNQDYPLFTKLSLGLIGIARDVERGLRAAAELRDYFGGILAERRRAPRDDMITLLAGARIDGEPLPDEEIFGFLRLLLPAGAETTYRLLGNMLFALLANPEQLEALTAKRELIGQAIEETLRWEAPVQFISREATAEVEIAGVAIPAGAQLSCALGSANHDEAVFDEPERFDLFAARAPHLAFAEGPHRCLGEHLARAEVTVAVNVILDRLGALRLHPGDADPHIQGVPFRSPTSLPVRFDPA